MHMKVLYIDNTDAETIIGKITKSLHDLHLNIHQLRGQWYDGVGAMSGGVATQVQQLESRAIIYTHCYGHLLNLAADDTIK